MPRRDDRERQACSACDYIHYVGPVLAAGLIVRNGDRVCLVRRAHDPGAGKWTFPGGFVDLQEEPADAARRETREEAGCDAVIESLVGVYRSQGPGGKPVVIAVYVGRFVEDCGATSEETQEVRWFEPHELPWEEFAFASSVAALKAVLAAR